MIVQASVPHPHWKLKGGFSIWPEPGVGISAQDRMQTRQAGTQMSTSACEKVQSRLLYPDGEKEDQGRLGGC